MRSISQRDAFAQCNRYRDATTFPFSVTDLIFNAANRREVFRILLVTQKILLSVLPIAKVLRSYFRHSRTVFAHFLLAKQGP
jgi:hypothetical protein